MSIFVIGDLHLSFEVNKPMNVFGNNWDNYEEKIKNSWLNKVNENDTVIIPGDFSWAMRLEETKKDFEFINQLPGKKLISKGMGFALAGTLLFSTASCSNGTWSLGNQELLENYSNGYYMQGHCLKDMLVVEIEEGKFKIVDEDLKSVYSNEKYTSGKRTELYEHLNKTLLHTKTVNKTDLMNIEKYINGSEDVDLSYLKKEQPNNLLIENDKVFMEEQSTYYIDAGLSEVEVLFLDGKASRIVRRTEEENKSVNTNADNETIDIISGNKVHPGYAGPKKYSTFAYANMDRNGYREYEFIALSDLMTSIVKDEYTADEVVELFYMIQGKTKEEVIEILSKYNKIYIDENKTKDTTKVKTK